MAKKNDTPPQRYCPECDLNGTHPTTEGVCPRCGFMFLTSPERVEWFPSEEGGVEFGVAEDTPLWGYMEGLADYYGITEHSDADQPAPQGRGEALRAGLNDDKAGKDACRLENRLRAIASYYADDSAGEQEGFNIDKIRKHAFGADIGPDHAPRPGGKAGHTDPAALCRMTRDPS